MQTDSCQSTSLGELTCLMYADEELLPFSDDADEGCQWEVQTDEGWTPY
jgi:hypothetical protein